MSPGRHPNPVPEDQPQSLLLFFFFFFFFSLFSLFLFLSPSSSSSSSISINLFIFILFSQIQCTIKRKSIFTSLPLSFSIVCLFSTMASLAEPRVHPRRRPLLTPPPCLSPPEGHFRIKKGETFHSPTSPPSKDRDPVMAVRLTPRRSPTCPDTLKAIAAGEQRMANILDNFDLNSIGSSSPSSTSGASYSPHSDYDLPVPRGFLETKAGFNATPAPETSNKRPMMDSSRPNSPPAKRRQHEHLSDSGLGTSISDNQGISADKGMAKGMSASLSSCLTVYTHWLYSARRPVVCSWPGI